MTNISINKLHEFRDHPYQVLDNDEMNSLIESVQQQGIMTPLIVRPLEDTTDEYEIISGHRRFRAHRRQDLQKYLPLFVPLAVTKQRLWWWTAISTGSIFYGEFIDLMCNKHLNFCCIIYTKFFITGNICRYKVNVIF